MLTDFGIAKALDDTQSITGFGGAVGTPAYMAPEILLGQPATPACDQYSLGCMAYELLSGHTPFDGDAGALREAHVEQQPVALSQAAPHVSRQWRTRSTLPLPRTPSAVTPTSAHSSERRRPPTMRFVGRRRSRASSPKPPGRRRRSGASAPSMG